MSAGFFKLMDFIKTPKFFVLWLLVFALLYVFVDQACTWWVYHHANYWLLTVAHYVTQLGLGAYSISIFVVLLGSGLIMHKDRLWQASAYVLFTLLASGLVCDTSKIIFGRARPYQMTLHHIYGFKFFEFSNNYWSFPSGHATTISALTVALGYLFPRYWLWFFLIALLVMLSRVVLLMHFPSDVWAGFYLGALTSALLYRALSTKLTKLGQNKVQ